LKLIKRIIIIIAIIIALVIIGITALYFTSKKSLAAYQNFDFASLDLSQVDDGTYTGLENGGIVEASVEVNVKDHTITKVTILSHKCGKGKPAEVITDDIVAANSLEVDTISGATFSSDVIRKAVYNALTK